MRWKSGRLLQMLQDIKFKIGPAEKNGIDRSKEKEGSRNVCKVK